VSLIPVAVELLRACSTRRDGGYDDQVARERVLRERRVRSDRSPVGVSEELAAALGLVDVADPVGGDRQGSEAAQEALVGLV